jgi:ubiquitin C-terminal hydrolase
MALAIKELDIRMFPPVLVLHLNRFKNHEGRKIKNSEPIAYE